MKQLFTVCAKLNTGKTTFPHFFFFIPPPLPHTHTLKPYLSSVRQFLCFKSPLNLSQGCLQISTFSNTLLLSISLIVKKIINFFFYKYQYLWHFIHTFRMQKRHSSVVKLVWRNHCLLRCHVVSRCLGEDKKPKFERTELCLHISGCLQHRIR